MKWFHHECAARHDPKLQILGEAHGAEGIGIYWCLLEELGHHSDSFCLQILDAPLRPSPRLPAGGAQTSQIPRIPMKILARNLFTTPKKLISVITTCVDVQLFDAQKWNKQGILYSPSFEHRADDYTRRVQRRSNTVRTLTGHHPDSDGHEGEHHTVNRRRSSANRSPETEQNERTKEDQQNRRENVDNIMPSMVSDPADDELLVIPTDAVFDRYCVEFHAILQRWNASSAQPLAWHPSIPELRKLFYDGQYERKLTMCYHAFKLLHQRLCYPELVLRALRLMLKSAAAKPIENPVGWLWTCLHGNTNGTRPWAQLLTSEEESH